MAVRRDRIDQQAGRRLEAAEATAGDVLYDLRAGAAPLAAAGEWLGVLRDGGLRELTLDFADGAAYVLRRPQRWRLWRRPLRTLGT